MRIRPFPTSSFDHLTDAINWISDQGWAPESWFQPTGAIEEKIRVIDMDGNFKGDLIRICEGVMLIRDGQHRTPAARITGFGERK